jgi:putative transposase
MIDLINETAPKLSLVEACDAIGLSRATYYRRRHGEALGPKPKRKAPPRALRQDERQVVLDKLHEPRFVDASPTEVFAELLDEGEYLCSLRTMYRILSANDEVRERRRQTSHPPRVKPQLCATAPNQVWTWDITKLLGPKKWTYFYLYVILDIFSRYVVGWLIATRESAALAQRLITETCARQGIEPGTLAVHQDRGAPMTSKPFAQPAFPGRFDDLRHAEQYCRDFFEWYNLGHHHSGIGLMTPHDLHHGLALAKWQHRAEVLAAAYAEHPERFPNGPPTPPPLPVEVWINQPSDTTIETQAIAAVGL